MRASSVNARKNLRGNRLHKAIHRARPAAVVGWQEIESHPHLHAVDTYKGLDTYFPGGRYKHGKRKGQPKRNARNATPISYRSDVFRFKAGHWSLAIPGIAHVGPSRFTVWCNLHRKSDNHVFIVINVHTVSGIWKKNRQAHHKQWGGRTRRAMWRHHMAQVRRRIRKVKKRHPGCSIIVTGDFNHPTKLTEAQLGVTPHYASRPTHGHNWYDVIGTHNLHVTETRRRTATPSDHDVLWARMFTKRAA